MKLYSAIGLILFVHTVFTGCSSDPKEVTSSQPGNSSDSMNNAAVDSQVKLASDTVSTETMVLSNYEPIGNSAPEIKAVSANVLPDRLNVKFTCTSSNGFVGGSKTSMSCEGVPLKDMRFGLVERENMTSPENDAESWLTQIFDPKQVLNRSSVDCKNFCAGNFKQLYSYPNTIGKQGHLVVGFQGVINPNKVYIYAAEYRGAYRFGFIKFDSGVRSLPLQETTNPKFLNSKFLKSCGQSPDEFYKKNAAEMTGSYTSFPIVVEGQKQVLGTGFEYRIIFSSKAQLTMNGGVISFSNVFSTVSAEASSPLLRNMTKDIADRYAKSMTVRTDSTLVSVGDWLNTTEFNEAFTNLMCAPIGTSSTSSWTSSGEILTKFSPLLVNHLSPLVSFDRLTQEIPGDRSFNVTADVNFSAESKNPDLRSGQKSGSVTIKKIAPRLSVINGDIAYEITNDFPGGAYTVGLPKRVVYLLDASHKKVKAFSVEMDNPAGIDLGLKQNVPVIYVRNNEQ